MFVSLFSTSSEIQKHEDTLKEYQLYKRFLDSLAPKEWKQERRLAHYQRKERAKQKKRCGEEENPGQENEGEEDENEGKDGGSEANVETAGETAGQKGEEDGAGNINANNAGQPDSKAECADINFHHVIEVDEEGISSESDSEIGEREEEEEPDLYFTDPNQLLDMLGDLEEQNLSLIQNRWMNP